MKPFSIRWWIAQLTWVVTLKVVAIHSANYKETDRWATLEKWIEDRIETKYGE